MTEYERGFSDGHKCCEKEKELLWLENKELCQEIDKLKSVLRVYAESVDEEKQWCGGTKWFHSVARSKPAKDALAERASVEKE